MKIVEVITFLGSGGAERFIVDLSNELSKGNEIYLLTILDDKKDSEIRNFYRFAIDDRVHYINLGLPNGLSIRSQMSVIKVFNTIKPDVIHFHMIPTVKYCALACVILSFKYKMYLTIHSDLHNGYDKGFAKVIFMSLSYFKRLKLVCLSEKNYIDFSSYYPYAQVRCIVNGRSPIIPTCKFEAVKKEMQSYRSKCDSFLFLHIARFNRQKNQYLLIDAFNQLCSDYNLDLIIIGDGFDSVEGKKLVARSNQEHIHFLGTRKNVSDYMLNADFFCLSSDFEGMPITLLEASLAGVPAVSTPVCGAVDLIQNGVNGYLSKDHSLEEYKKTIIKAVEDYHSLKSNAMIMKDNSPYTIAECAKKYMEYFKE